MESRDVENEADWRLERDADGIASLYADKVGSGTNVLSATVLAGLDAQLALLERDPPRGLVVLSAKSSGFIAGADIKEFIGVTSSEAGYELIRAGQRIIGRLAALPCPTVAALHGFALGGGLELALACRYRIALDDGRLSLGLPEVQLGIHPGFGGTVRSVRLLGVRQAMKLMLTGKPVRAAQALEMGLVDRLVRDAATLRSAARDMAARPRLVHRPAVRDLLLGLAPLRPVVARTLERQLAARAPRDHYPAPYALIELWRRHGARGPAAYEAEARSIGALFTSATARNLIRVFLLQDRLKGLAGRTRRDFRRLHVIGAGVMGGDIAAWGALRGLEVTIEDPAGGATDRALSRAQELFDRRVRDPAERAAVRTRLRAAAGDEDVGNADVVIEAIYEDLAAKQALYARLQPQLRPDALLATNTSSIGLDALGAGLEHPERLVGLHFFNPVAQMPLVEIVHTATTPAELRETAIAFARRLDKLPVPCRSAPGFIVNRVLMPYLQEAMHAAAEGVTPGTIDAAAVGFGMPMGPVELADVVGLDVARNVGRIVAQGLGRQPARLARLDELIDAGHLGRKSGAGFYAWRDGKPVRDDAAARGSAGTPSAAPSDLVDRLILILVNECVAVLREQIAADADLVDAAVIFGTGFAPFRGGPLAWARASGPEALVQRLRELEARHGSRFAPDPGWSALA